MTPFPQRGAGFLRDLFGGRTATWPDLSERELRQLSQALRDHGVMPLAYDALQRGLAVAVPPALVSRLRDAYLATAVQNAVWLQERDRILAVLDSRGIGAVVLKGTALMDAVYESVALRPVVDIDLLVLPDQIGPSVDALVASEYEPVATDAEAYGHHVELRGRGQGGMPVAVELHRRLFASPPYDRVLATEDVLRRAFNGSDPATGLAPADCLLHLSGHLVLQHARCERLVWVADVDRLVRAHGAERAFWDDVLSRAPESLLSRCVSDALALARLWFDTPIPPEATARVGEQSQTDEETAAYVRLRGRAPVGEEGARLLDDVRGVPGFAAKIRFAAAHMAPSPGTMRTWYGLDHAWQLPVYYARRALRGVAHIARRPFHRGSAIAVDPPDLWMIEHDA